MPPFLPSRQNAATRADPRRSVRSLGRGMTAGAAPSSAGPRDRHSVSSWGPRPVRRSHPPSLCAFQARLLAARYSGGLRRYEPWAYTACTRGPQAHTHRTHGEGRPELPAAFPGPSSPGLDPCTMEAQPSSRAPQPPDLGPGRWSRRDRPLLAVWSPWPLEAPASNGRKRGAPGGALG